MGPFKSTGTMRQVRKQASSLAQVYYLHPSSHRRRHPAIGRRGAALHLHLLLLLLLLILLLLLSIQLLL
jgi:hypothetical protein